MKPKNNKDREQHVNGLATEDNGLVVQKRIALRAYELYLQRGGLDGHAEEDWFRAEQEILKDERH